MMNKKIYLSLIFFLLFWYTGYSQVPANWSTNRPRDTEQTLYYVSISRPSVSVQEALNNTWQDAVQYFASSIITRFQSDVVITVQSEFLESVGEDAFTVYMETTSFSTNVPVSGIKELARMPVERSNNLYTATVLYTMSVEDFNKALQYIENEEAASLAFRFFAQRGLFTLTDRPPGYDDFYLWLRNNCVVLILDHNDPDPFLQQLDILVRKLYRNSAIFPGMLHGLNARIIYDSPRYYSGLLRTIQSFNVFSINLDGTQITLRPNSTASLAALRTRVAETTEFTATVEFRGAFNFSESEKNLIIDAIQQGLNNNGVSMQLLLQSNIPTPYRIIVYAENFQEFERGLIGWRSPGRFSIQLFEENRVISVKANFNIVAYSRDTNISNTITAIRNETSFFQRIRDEINQ